MSRTAAPPRTAWLVALLCTAAAVVARMALTPWLGEPMPFLPHLAATGIAAWYAGTTAGWVALVAGALAGELLVIGPRGSVRVADVPLLLGLVLYGAAGAAWILTLRSVRRHGARRGTGVAAAAGSAALADTGSPGQPSQISTLLDQLPIGVGAFDRYGKWIIRNDAIRRATGDTIPSLADNGESRMRAWGPDGRPLAQEDWPGARALRGETVSPGVDVLYTMEDGEERWLNISCAPFFGETGSLLGAIVVAQDADVRKRAELALQASEERLRLILDSASDFAILTLDTGGLITSWNTGARNLFGYEADEVVGRQNVRFMFTSDDQARGLPELEIEHALANGRSEDERWHQRRNGTKFWASGLMMVLREPGTDRAMGFLKILRDRTDARRWEETLERETEELKASDQRKNEFLATLAHELRNPLAPIRTGVALIQRAPHDSDAVQRAAAMMERQVRHMVRLIDDLLEVSRISRRQIELQPSLVRLSAIIQAAIETSRPAIDEAGHTLSVDIADDVLVNADETRMAQVFGNLLNNAAKFTSPGGRIRLTAHREAGEAVASVSDNGAGIPPQMLPHIFEMFSQADGLTGRQGGGLGIGLTIVRQLVEMQGGRVEAHSEGPGLGSTFTVRLPLHQGPAFPATGAAETEPRRAGPAARRKVLVADDNPDSAATLMELLTMLGHDVRVAHDGLEAVEGAADFRPDVILLDISMPRLDGYEACRRIRRQPWGSRPLIAAMTGLGQEDDRRRSSEAGFDRHLVKPVDPAAIERLLEGGS
ncbi:MAG TPA: ATP-binding protein [Vicinamibacterales bacterium]